MFRRGSVLVRAKETVATTRKGGKVVERERQAIVVVHEDLIRDEFWQRYPQVLSGKAP